MYDKVKQISRALVLINVESTIVRILRQQYNTSCTLVVSRSRCQILRSESLSAESTMPSSCTSGTIWYNNSVHATMEPPSARSTHNDAITADTAPPQVANGCQEATKSPLLVLHGAIRPLHLLSLNDPTRKDREGVVDIVPNIES